MNFLHLCYPDNPSGANVSASGTSIGFRLLDAGTGEARAIDFSAKPPAGDQPER
jgi:hypothetical protein